MNKDQGRGLSRRAFVGKVTAGAAGGALAAAAISLGARGASALSVSGGNGAAGSMPTGTDHTADGMASATELAASDEQLTPGAITETAPAPWDVLRPLRAGAALGDGWYLKDLSGVVAGACVLTLANRRGREQRVHLCRNGGAPQGLVYTERFDMVAMNGGRGDLPTEEGFGQAVAAVAHVIAANERRADELDGLLSQADREERFAAAAELR